MKKLLVAFVQLAACTLVPSTISDLLYFYQVSHSSYISSFAGGIGFVVGFYFVLNRWDKE